MEPDCGKKKNRSSRPNDGDDTSSMTVFEQNCEDDEKHQIQWKTKMKEKQSNDNAEEMC